MKLFLKNILLFAFIFFIIEKGLYYFINTASVKEYDKRLELVLNGKMNKDIVIIGSSRGAHDIIAKQIEDDTNLKTYNLSYRGSDVTFHEFILSTLLRFNVKPKKVLLVIDTEYEFIKEKTLDFRTDYLQPYKKYNYINSELIKRGSKNVLSRFFCLARINKKDFDFSKKEIPVLEILTSHGSKLVTKKTVHNILYKKDFHVYNFQNEKKEKVLALHNIQDLCKEYDIELIYIFPPNYGGFNSHFYKRFKQLIKYNNKVMIYDTLNVKYKDEIYFQDQSHLLKKGAEIFTSEISTFIINDYNK